MTKRDPSGLVEGQAVESRGAPQAPSQGHPGVIDRAGPPGSGRQAGREAAPAGRIRGLLRRRLRPRPAHRQAPQGLRRGDGREARGGPTAVPQLPHHRPTLQAGPHLLRRPHHRDRHLQGGAREQPGDDEELLIVDDNEYGTANPDAKRRDFTVNALFLDPTTHEIHDFVKGMDDLEDRVIRTIGDPEVRLAEDPVRILRAIKFSARLDLEIEDDTWDAMCEVADDLEKAALPRVLEEILRLCRSGTAVAAFQMMRDVGALAVLVPQLEDHLGPEDDIPERAEPFWDLLAALDARVRAAPQDPPSAGLLIAVLFAHPFALALEEEVKDGERLDARGRASVAWEVLQPLSEATRLSRKDLARARRVLVAQQNFTDPPERFSELLFARSEEFEEALELFSLESQARGAGSDLVEAWQERRRRAADANLDELETERRRTRKRKRRRRRRRPSKG